MGIKIKPKWAEESQKMQPRGKAESSVKPTLKAKCGSKTKKK